MKTLTAQEFAGVFTRLAIGMPMAEHAALEVGAKIVEAEAKRAIGTYDYGWPALQPETIARKQHGDTPLLETGAMRDSIEHTVLPGEAHVGSNDEKLVFHELGTRTIPPRPVLTGAAVRKAEEVAHAVGRVVHAHLIGEKINREIV